MSELECLKPHVQQHIMDLVRDAGIDVSDWANFKGGINKAKSNPKYCYNWSFIGSNAVVLNLWYEQIEESSDRISMTNNFRLTSNSDATKGIWKKRARQFDEAVRTAYKSSLTVRVIVNDGSLRQGNSKTTKASKVHFRLLDPTPWTVTSYDDISGQFVLTRGNIFVKATDQFTVDPEGKTFAERYSITEEVFIRSPEVRRLVLERAGGKCEYCGEDGFKTNDGSLFLETHHIVPLSEGGSDNQSNVAALCPNHHREAHHGVKARIIRSELLNRIANLIAPLP